MAIYTIRANTAFTIVKQGVVYGAGEQIDLTNIEFERHKHKLEGTKLTVTPIVFESVNGKVGSSNSTVTDVIVLTQADYNAITPKSATTLYVINE
ncbi:phage upper tail fiber protein [Pleurocapsa sp. FMAR1]|uniref:phage upper tail fiber protein n=1 Tax=Pleurocapsa sp. FMAR1 TaxID=3040204 RepID=UPI0029C61E55|nr:hypothetical protein [Pleurocapsa sp. FMAR1]